MTKTEAGEMMTVSIAGDALAREVPRYHLTSTLTSQSCMLTARRDEGGSMTGIATENASATETETGIATTTVDEIAP